MFIYLIKSFMNREINPLRFLVIEDNPWDSILLKHALEISQLPISTISYAETMAEARILVNENRYDIALLDLTLPDSSGLDSVNSLNKLIPETPIIVLSGLATIEIALESILLGAQDYLIKGEYDEKLLSKSVQFGIERKKLLKNLHDSLVRYELVNRATQDIIWEWDIKKDEIIRNEAFTIIFGYANDPVKNNHDWVMSITHPDDREQLKNSVQNCIDHKQENWEEAYRIKDAYGVYREVFDRAFIQFDEKGNPVKMIGSFTDLTDRRKLEKALHDQQLNQQKMLLEVNIQAHEDEKNELGKELHDNINQMLATVKMYLGMIKSGRSIPDFDLVSKSYDYLEQAIIELRKLSHSLVPPSLGEIGLDEALHALVNDINVVQDLDIRLLIDKKCKLLHLDKKMALMIFRIVQEQLSNITKYARAKQVIITIKKDKEELRLMVTDDGIGFNVLEAGKGIGLKNMANRLEYYAGKLKIITTPGKGCTIEATIPFNFKNKTI